MATKTNRKATKATRSKTTQAADAPVILPVIEASVERTKAKKAPIDAPRSTKATTKASRTERLSALDAAARVLTDAAEPMTCRALIEAMAARGLWTSPGGQTPHATLYSALLREINTKGDNARFVKVDRGRFAAR